MNPAILIPVLILAGVGLFLWRATRRPAEAPRQADPAPRPRPLARSSVPSSARERPSLFPPVSRRADPAPTRRDDPVSSNPLTDPLSPLNPVSPVYYGGSSSYDSGGSCSSSGYDSGSSSSSSSDGGSSGGGCD